MNIIRILFYLEEREITIKEHQSSVLSEPINE